MGAPVAADLLISSTSVIFLGNQAVILPLPQLAMPYYGMAVRAWRTVLVVLVALSIFTTGAAAVSSVMPVGTMMLRALPSLSFRSAQQVTRPNLSDSTSTQASPRRLGLREAGRGS